LGAIDAKFKNSHVTGEMAFIAAPALPWMPCNAFLLPLENEMVKNDDSKESRFNRLDSLRQRANELAARRAGRQIGEDGIYQGDDNYRTLVNNLDVGIYRNTGGPQGRFLRANPAMARLFGFESVEAFLEARVSDLYVNPEERKLFVEELLRTGVVRNKELLLRRKDGSQFWASLTSTAAFGADGSLTWIDGMVQDISERRKAEEELRQSSEKYTKAFRQAPVMVVISTLEEGRYLEVNEAFERIMGFSKEEVVGKTAYELGVWHDLADRGRIVEQIRRNGSSARNTIKFRTKDGELRIGLFSAETIQIDGQECMISMATDITESSLAMAALRESEEKYAKAFRQSPFWVLITSLAEGRYLEINEAFLRSVGLAREDLLGKTTLETGLWVDPAKRREVVQEIERTGSVSNKEVEFRVAGGQVRNMLLSADEIILGGERCMLAVSVDITERKQAEKALGESEEKYRILVENQSDLVIKVDLEGRFQFVSPSYCRLFGKTEQELLGQPFLSLVHVEDREAAANLLKQVLDPPHTAQIEQRADTNLGWRWLSWVHTAVLDEAGKAVEIIGVGRDVSERRKALQALLESEEKYRTLTQNMQDVVFLVQDGVIKHINDRIVRMAGFTAQELIGQNFLDLIAPEYRETVAERHLRRIAGEDVPSEYEMEILAKDGGHVLVNSYVSMVNYEGGLAAMGTFKDITEIKRAEEEKARLQAQLQHAQKMEAIGTLASGIAHDFNNILQGVRGYLKLLELNAGKPDRILDYAKDIDGAVARATDLIQRMLAFGRKLEPELSLTDLNQVVKQAFKLLERTIPKMITIETELSPALKPIKGDPNQLEQIIINLANNAADAMPQGGRLLIQTENAFLDQVYCQQHLDAKPGEYVSFTISDTGCGMDQDILSKIFDPFFTTKEVGRGSGLGLSIVYGIVQSHGGQLSCYSEKEVGSTFRIHLPVSGEQAVEALGKSEVPQEAVGGDETILVVDDEPVILDVVKEALTFFGYTVVTAQSGEEALQIHSQGAYCIDLTILDVGMPGMGGIKCLRELKARQPEAKVLVASGYSLDERLKDIRSQGAAGFLAKPYRTEELLAAVRNVLDG
jgi:two-component system cell cycle sensor histidine kinase/response regulator CckA